MAAQQIFSREQLATWDSSARSWLQTADADRILQQTQLMLIINNVRMPVNTREDSYQGILEAWTLAMRRMEQLVQGVPQRIQDRAVLLATSSWHLYPVIQVLVGDTKSVNFGDELLNGSVITISAQGANESREGVFWSLPLSRMRYYSPPVLAARQLALDTSRIPLDEFWRVILGIHVSNWKCVRSDPGRYCKIHLLLAKRVDLTLPSPAWLKNLAAAVRQYIVARGIEQGRCAKLIGFGARWCALAGQISKRYCELPAR
ncbi:hypothetical protein BJX64DRAFT_294358 [Aspergillus heterothallicus]